MKNLELCSTTRLGISKMNWKSIAQKESVIEGLLEAKQQGFDLTNADDWKDFYHEGGPQEKEKRRLIIIAANGGKPPREWHSAITKGSRRALECF